MTAGAGPSAAAVAKSSDLNSRGRPHEVKLARRTAREIETDILAANLSPGTIYASEPELRKRYGVSRAVLRESIRLVEHHGLAVMRRGPYGGLVLRAPDSRALTQAVAVYLEFVGTSVEDLLAVRCMLEPAAARLAAQRLTEEDITTLRTTLEEERSFGEFEPSRRDLLHTLMGNIGGNRVLGLFTDVLVRLTERYASIPVTPAEEASALSTASDRAHAGIVEAIVAGNAMLAEHRCLGHLDAMRDWLMSVQQRPIRRSGDAPVSETPGSRGREKLAEPIARQLMADIAASGVPVGEIYASETELLKRLDVSRAAFREAVRLLEYHSVARMRRGSYGGLVITSPDPSAAVDAMAVYLEYQKVGVDELRVVREAIELGALELLSNHHGDAAIVDELRGAQQVDATTPAADIPELSHEFHLRMADLTGNPVLSLFVRILISVTSRHYPAPNSVSLEGTPVAPTVSHAHDRILEAIASGDLPLARHRMHRHLEALDEWWQSSM